MTNAFLDRVRAGGRVTQQQGWIARGFRMESDDGLSEPTVNAAELARGRPRRSRSAAEKVVAARCFRAEGEPECSVGRWTGPGWWWWAWQRRATKVQVPRGGGRQTQRTAEVIPAPG